MRYEGRMKSVLALLAFSFLLPGCATSRFVPDSPMHQVDPYSRVGVQHTDSGFRIRVEYTEKNRAIHEVIDVCRSELISFAEQYAQTFPRQIKPIQKDEVKIEIQRLPAGVRGGQCDATAWVEWSS